MRGNLFGKLLSIHSFGESHGPALGVIVDGVPAGLKVDQAELQKALDARAPGKIPGVTSRKEPDQAEILSGVFEDKTLGTPIMVMVRNTNQRSQDYAQFKNVHRPGHADLTTEQKYGHRDYRGGGRASARETLARVIGGYFASLILPQIFVKAIISKMGPFEETISENFDWKRNFGAYHFANPDKEKEIAEFLKGLKGSANSCGGRIHFIVDQTPSGLGEPVYDKLKADLGKGLLSINACTAFSIGLGQEFASLYGVDVSGNHDAFGGIEGGISNGNRIFGDCVFKPTSTIGEMAKHGRHDPCVLPRAIPVVEAMIKLVLADHYLRQLAYQVGTR